MRKRGSSSTSVGPNDVTVSVASKLGALFQELVAREQTIDTHVAALLATAAEEQWSTLDPIMLGRVFQSLMQPSERHVRGAHYTSSKAILEYIVRPILLEPWRARIRNADTLNDLLGVHEALTKIRILDPACGSGNFLYEAYQALKQLEQEIIEKAQNRFSARTFSSVSTRQLFGIDIDPLATELTKVILLLSEKPGNDKELDDNIRCADALFCEWPQADLIIGNPPFQSKNRMQQEFGPEYVQRLRQNIPTFPAEPIIAFIGFAARTTNWPPGHPRGSLVRIRFGRITRARGDSITL